MAISADFLVAMDMWHYPLLAWFRGDGALGDVIAVALAFALAELSWWLVECPALRLRSRGTGVGRHADSAAIGGVGKAGAGAGSVGMGMGMALGVGVGAGDGATVRVWSARHAPPQRRGQEPKQPEHVAQDRR